MNLTCFLGPPSGNEVWIILLLIAAFTAIWLLSTASKWIAEKIWKGKAKMQNALQEHQLLLGRAFPLLESISEEESSIRPAEGKWSKKEILGHLIDSASNNHQRFVRAMLAGEIKLPEYDQEAWVRTQSYQTESWHDLVHLWKLYNTHLLHIGAKIPTERLKSTCFIGENQPVTLEFLVVDYVRHLKHHLHQILPSP
jgi:hypothetical protein